MNLVAALHDSLMAFEQQIAKARVHVVFEPKETPMVLSQQVQLSQILNSLLANALEAMDKGARWPSPWSRRMPGASAWW